MKVLIACEFSGTVRRAFEEKGHYVISSDLLPSDDNGNHYWGDVRDILHNDWDLIIAHPPCTYLCNSGVRWLSNNKERQIEMIRASRFFKLILSQKCEKICIENPIMHKYAKEIIGQSQSQVIQPFMFGHPERKATCLWLKGLSLLKETNNVKQEMLKLPKKEQNKIHYASPGKDRWKVRSKTFSGIAQAMADQWG